MIIYPLAKFAAVVLSSESLKSYHNVALWYLNSVIETVDYFQQWYVAEENGGYYMIQNEDFWEDRIRGINAPVNWNAAMGKVLLALYDATGEERYLAQAKALAETLKAALEVADNGSYVWYYWFGAAYERYKREEDISHGALDVQFAIQCYEHGVVFSAEDIQRFAFTLRENIWNGRDFTYLVSGGGEAKPQFEDAGIKWISLGRCDHETLELIREYIAKKNFQDLPMNRWDWYMLAISELIHIEVLQNEAR